MELADDLLTEPYANEDWVVYPINRLLIDTDYKRTEVENAIRLLKSHLLSVSKGWGIRAAGKPICEYQREPGDRFRYFWVERIPKGCPFKTIFLDINYWKTEVHNSFFLGVGDRTGLSLWGDLSGTAPQVPETSCHRASCPCQSGGTGTLRVDPKSGSG
ncbi:MAG: hypothetical protein ACOX6D_01000 [Thermoguttaceae bacterium]|jgi:hypothetical protein